MYEQSNQYYKKNSQKSKLKVKNQVLNSLILFFNKCLSKNYHHNCSLILAKYIKINKLKLQTFHLQNLTNKNLAFDNIILLKILVVRMSQDAFDYLHLNNFKKNQVSSFEERKLPKEFQQRCSVKFFLYVLQFFPI